MVDKEGGRAEWSIKREEGQNARVILSHSMCQHDVSGTAVLS